MLNEIKRYLRLEPDFIDDDKDLEELILTAKATIRSTTGKQLLDEPLLFKLGVKFLVVHWYQNRAIVTEKQVNNVSYTLDMILDDLSLKGIYV